MFDLTAARSEELAFKGSVTNGQRGNLMNGTLDRSASFREGNEGKMFISGANMSRGNSTSAGDLTYVTQCLMLDPITMGDQKYTRSGELRRVLGISFGNTLEDYAFGTANLKSPPPVATEELKLFKASVKDASIRARSRSKRLDESLDKLNKCWEAVSLKKQLRNDLLPNERLGGLPFSKMGSQTHRNPSELVNQRLEDRTKNNLLNKRIRTSVAETRAEGLSNSNARQPLAIGKDRDNIKDVSRGCDIVEEKIRRLPAGGETWDRKMKRKRSMGIVVARSIDGEGELKKVTHLRLANDSGLQGSDAHGSRSGYSGTSSKLDGSSSPTPNACTAANNEREKVSRGSVDGSNKERIVLKGNKFNIRDNNHTGGIHTLSKGKASRPPRTGALMAGNSCSVSRSSELHETEEQPLNVNKPHSVSGTVNRKRPLPVGSSSSPMAQWVGQRPQKITRTRRANVMSPVLNCDEVHTSLEGSSPSDVGTRMSSTISGLHTSNGAINSGIQPVKVKHENMSSPIRLSVSQESGAGENNLKVKRMESNEINESATNHSYVTSSSMLTSKNKKITYKEEIGDDLRRQGRGGRGSSVLKSGILPMKEKLETSTLMKPIKNMKPASEKNGSKPGRPPLKKSCDRKAIIRTGHPLTNNSPDISVEDDDREELLTAANFASDASYIGCSSSFWKNLEPIFAPVSLENMSYLKHLVKTTDVDLRCLSQTLGLGSDALSQDRLTHTENPVSQSPLASERDRSTVNQTDSKEISLMDNMVDQHLDFSILCRQMGSEGNKGAPLYQRVLTALIIDDQIDEDIVGDGHMTFLCERDGSSQLPCFFHGVENQSNIKMEYVFNSGKVSCNGNAMHTSCANIPIKEPGVSLQIDQGSLYPETERLAILSEDDNDRSLGMHINSCSSSFSCHFEQMSMEDKLLLELESVGLYPEQVPDLADGDCEAINQDIMQLQKGLFQQVNKKRECFMKLIQAVERGREMEQRALEQVAMDKLVELAFKKKLATRGTSAARYGLSKVSRPVALAFMKRTLARCHKFEETGRSCFLDPVFKDALVAAPSRDNNTGSAIAANLSLGQNSQQEFAPSGYFPRKEQDVSGNLDQPSDQDFARTGPIVNRGKKKELLLDDVGASPSLRSASTPGGAKGKRSERDRDKDSSGKISVTKGGRSSASHARGERKTKAKSKPKTAQISSSGNGPLSKLMENNNSEHQLACGSNEFISSHGSRKSKTGSVPHNVSTGTEERMDITNLHELDSIELGVGNELTGPQDLDSWLLNIDDDLQGNDAIGLEIPMDDLSDLNMIL
ncbi:uncharacterized protein LOC106772023 isoform X2 [Vigna radiata var. radiata]|uniref:Uncharacterized protein LOC106772023 isoform X2 n=1 Tax=Vigna radiata var. radiata TaxID=3916 RepID=A0A1S3V5K1_VIGRR|nr:uncharacterized protein LOC106772023 isoform X2 [Vigna radiata var. radiata]XP_022641495.1 uncharacterized protein LOC106772023 isoform X2 [Vigna radiata var. radiata]